MTTRFIEGFESGSISPNSSTNGTFNIQNTIFRTGAYALEFNLGASVQGRLALSDASADGRTTANMGVTGSFYTNVYFRVDTAPSGSDAEEIVSYFTATGPAYTLFVKIDSNRKLRVYDKDNSLVATGTSVLALNTWYRVGVKGTVGTSGAYEVRINGATELSGTCNQTGNNIDVFIVGPYQNRTTSSVLFYYDDIIGDDAGWPPDGSVVAMVPNANSSPMVWTTGTGLSNWQEVDELPPDGGTTYVRNSGTVANQVALFGMQNCSDVGITGTVNAVCAYISVRENAGVTSANRLRVASGGTNSDTSQFNHSTSFLFKQKHMGVDPNGSIAWTTSNLDALIVGSIENNAVSMRMDAVWLQVHHTPPVNTRAWFALVA